MFSLPCPNNFDINLVTCFKFLSGPTIMIITIETSLERMTTFKGWWLSLNSGHNLIWQVIISSVFMYKENAMLLQILRSFRLFNWDNLKFPLISHIWCSHGESMDMGYLVIFYYLYLKHSISLVDRINCTSVSFKNKILINFITFIICILSS